MTRYVIVKVGGHALDAASDLAVAMDHLAADLKALMRDGYVPVVVHGAGPQITALSQSLGLTSTFVKGLRVTSEEMMSVVAMALSVVNLSLVGALNSRGVEAQGLAGPDRSLLTATPRGPRWGRAGGDVHVRTDVIEELGVGVVGVVNPVAVDRFGQLLNCNADEVAGALSGALGAEALVLLSDVDQLRLDPDDPSTAVGSVTRAEVATLIARGAIRDGMEPKVAAALCAVDAGARRVVIANGARPNALVAALSDEGLFTEVTK